MGEGNGGSGLGGVDGGVDGASVDPNGVNGQRKKSTALFGEHSSRLLIRSQIGGPLSQI